MENVRKIWCALLIVMLLSLGTIFPVNVVDTETISRETATSEDLSGVTDDTNLRSEFVLGEIIVKFRRSIFVGSKEGIVTVGFGSIDELNDRFKVTEIERVFVTEAPVLSNIYKLTLPKNADILSAVGSYEAYPEVEYAEPNYIYNVSLVPNDPDYWQQWAHQNIQSELAWDIERGDSNVVIAIVDTGVDWDHSDLAANIWSNSGEVPDNDIDDDNNGYVDDVRGWDFVDVPPDLSPMLQPAPGEDGTVRDNDPMDFNGHGTHVSGIAAAVTNNGIGIAGTSWNIRIMPVRAGYETVYGLGALLVDDAAAAIIYAVDNGANVISMSWGDSGSSDLIKDAIDYAYAKGAVLVAAAGNDNSISRIYPAGYDNTIAVAATTSSDDKASFSNYGSWVDVSAPGVNVYSTLFNDTYDSWSGTSMATPFVAGLAGLVLSKNPAFTNEKVRNVLRSTTDSVISSVYIGLGRINSYKAVLRDSILIANLHSSLNDATIGGVIDIRGTVNGTGFESYEVEYGLGIYPLSWTQIGPTYYELVVNNTLATWDTSSTTEGVHTIRLTAVDASGQKTVDMAVVTIDNSYITYPVDDDFLRAGDTIVITGTANGPYFQSYTTEYGEGSSPTTWTSEEIVLTNGGTVPVIDGVLATWDTSVITQANYYTLRLTVNLGSYNGTDYVTIVLDPDYQVGWPKKVPYRLVSTSVAVGDIDNDGDLEIIAGETGFGTPYGRNVYAWHHDGTDVSGWPKTNVASECITSSPALGDIDGDGDLEIFVGTEGGQVEAWHHDGSVVAGWPITTGGNVQSSPALGDIDADGDLEVVVGSWDGYVYAWHHNGSNVTGWPKTTGGRILSSPALGDIDGDGDLEVVVGSADYKVYAWHHDGSTVTGWPKVTGDHVDSSPALGDIDDDGDLEIFVGSWDGHVYAWHHDGTTITGWPKAVDGWAISSPALGDIDGDGDIEIVYGSWHGVIYAWHHDGSNVVGWPIDFASKLWPGASPVLGDIDGDLDIEILIASDKLSAWHHDGSTVTSFPKIIPTGEKWFFVYVEGSSPVLADLDKDGDIEIVLGNEGIFGGEGRLFVWDLNATYRQQTMEWPMFHHDERHTGLYSPPVHDVAVTNVVPSKTVVGQGYSISINVTVENQGDFTETFNVTLYANTTVIDTHVNVTLTSRTFTVVTFTWNTTGFAYDNYTISAEAILPPPIIDVDPTDNLYINGFVIISLPSDINGDRIVNALDLRALGNAYGSTPISPNWNPEADINNDLIINVIDLEILGKNYGKTA